MTDNNTRNISDENRVKLQELIDKCMDIWVILWWYKVLKVTITGHWTIIVYYKLEEPMIWPVERSIHDLFSKDSGVMEFVRRIRNIWNSIDIKNNSKEYINFYLDDEVKYHYMIMWPMTAEDKLQYFLDNAVLPQ